MISFFDAHTHVHFEAYKEDAEAVVRRALQGGVGMITVGTNLLTSEEAVAFAHQFPDDPVYAAVALHPSHTSPSFHDDQELAEPYGGEVFSLEAYLPLAKDPKTVAIGECGLDYFRLEEHTKEKQKAAFALQIDLAHAVQKPVMIHCRDAFFDLIPFLTERKALLLPGVIHFFTGTVYDARALLDLGFSFTFGGVITFTRAYDEVIQFIPSDRILTETDAPYVAPVPYRGKRNEPLYVIETTKKLAEIKGMALDAFAPRVLENVKRIFGVSF